MWRGGGGAIFGLTFDKGYSKVSTYILHAYIYSYGYILYPNVLTILERL